MKIGEVISSIEFSDSEKDRIADALLSGQGLSYKILTTKVQSIQDQDFWRGAQKRFKITGFRFGHQSARALVVRKAIDGLKNKRGHENEDIWPLYRLCARYYVIDELSDLNNILLNEDLEPSEGSLTEQIFRSIVEKLPLYEVDVDQIQKLYDLWGFERISNLDSILSKETISTDLIRRMISNDVEKSKRELTANISNLSSEIHREFDQLKRDSSSLFGKIDGLDDKINSTVAILRTEFQNLTATVMQKKVNEIGETFRKLAEKASPQLPKNAIVESEALIELQNRIDKLSKRVQRHDDAIAAAGTANQLVPKSVTRPSGSLRIGSLYDECISICVKHGLANPTLSLISILMKIMKNSRIVLTDRPNIILGILSAALNVDIQRFSASPLWINSSDWAEGIKLLRDKSESHIIVLSDFDVAIQESYLVPTLSHWFDDPSGNSLSRLVLVPSKPLLSAVSNRVLEMSSVLEFDSKWISRSNVKTDTRSSHHKNDNSVSLEEILGFSVSPNVEFESNLKKFANNLGIDLPPRLASQFVNLYMALSKELPDNEAGGIALEVTVLPWVRSVRGVSVGRIVEEHLKIAFAGNM